MVSQFVISQNCPNQQIAVVTSLLYGASRLAYTKSSHHHRHTCFCDYKNCTIIKRRLMCNVPVWYDATQVKLAIFATTDERTTRVRLWSVNWNLWLFAYHTSIGIVSRMASWTNQRIAQDTAHMLLHCWVQTSLAVDADSSFLNGVIRTFFITQPPARYETFGAFINNVLVVRYT